MRRIARGGFALVGVLLLLIQNDEADIFKRGEDCAARAHNNIGVALLDHPPLQQTLCVVERAVLHSQPAAEHCLKPPDHLRG